jgi:hypothetical protein
MLPIARSRWPASGKPGIILAVATILGGIAAVAYFVEIYKKRHPAIAPGDPSGPSSSRGSDAPVVESADVPETTPLAGGETQNHRLGRAQTELPSPPPDQVSVPDPIHLANALPFEAVVKILSDPKTTDLQKAQFTHREEGRFLIWTGEVQSVQPMNRGNPSSDVIVILSATRTEHSIFPDFASALFPNSETSVLTQVHVGDLIVIEGRLHFSSLTGR